jgi:hypothetical protein
VSDDGAEFGLRDGAAPRVALSTTMRVGARVGFLPEPFPARSHGDDFESAVFWRYLGDAATPIDLRLAYEKAWHQGTPDRDLLLASFEWTLADVLTTHGTAWVDHYDGHDSAKPAGFEITELWLGADLALGQEHGVGAWFHHQRWPQLQRREFDRLDPGLLQSARVDRFGAHTHHQLAEHLRASARIDAWQDERDQGLGGELRLDTHEGLWEHHDLGGSVFWLDGSFVTGPGVRLYTTQGLGAVQVTGRYEYSIARRHHGARSGELKTHTVGALLDWYPWPTWTVSLHGDTRFGDGQQTLELGLFTQVRF